MITHDDGIQVGVELKRTFAPSQSRSERFVDGSFSIDRAYPSKAIAQQ
jgi:hypothetical protein